MEIEYIILYIQALKVVHPLLIKIRVRQLKFVRIKMKRVLTGIPFIIFSVIIQSCGVSISSTNHEVTYDDYVSYEIYEISPSGRLSFIYSDCINLDDPVDRSGSVHVDTPYVGEDLYFSWENYRNSLDLYFEDDFHMIYSSSFSTSYFRSGNHVDFEIETEYSDYRIEFTGPYCNY